MGVVFERNKKSLFNIEEMNETLEMQVEEGCQLRSVDDIAAAAHHMVRIIEEEEGVLLC